MAISTDVFMSFFRGSVSRVCLADDWDFVKRGSIKVTLKKETHFLKGSGNGLPS